MSRGLLFRASWRAWTLLHRQQRDPSSPAEDLGGAVSALCAMFEMDPDEQQDTSEIIVTILSSLADEYPSPRK
jgi:hypothetical protein